MEYVMDNVPKQPQSCIDLSPWANEVSNAAPRSNNGQELCAVCRQIDLEHLTPSPECSPYAFHYHLGPVDAILKKEACALCRLISSLYHSMIWSGTPPPKDQLFCELRRQLLRHTRFPGPEQRSGTTEYRIVDLHSIRIGFSSPQGFHQSSTHAIHVCEDSEEPITPLRYTHMMPSTGRAVETDQVDFKVVKRWLDLCERSHGEVCNQPKGQRTMSVNSNIRLIDVQNSCIVDGSTNDRYLALSYVWGGVQQMTLNKRNHPYLKAPQSLEGEALPTVIRDAISVTRAINERYLWVDRLCILSDDEQDTVEQLSIMGNIYSNAVMTIVAACAETANLPLCGVEFGTRSVLQRSEIVHGIRYITGQPDLIAYLNGTHWRTRGWTFQESYLSTRCLIFTPYQVYFQCRSASWCEDSCCEDQLRMTFAAGNGLCDADDTAELMGYRCADGKTVFNMREKCAFKRYTEVVESFSGRTLTKDSDALWAFDGVAGVLDSELQQGFVWGMPVKNLDAALLWSSTELGDRPRVGTHKVVKDSRIVDMIFPSWSWLSRRGKVRYDAKCEEEVQGLVEWHRPVDYTLDPISDKWISVDNVDVDQVSDIGKGKGTSGLSMQENHLGLLCFTTSSACFDIEMTETFEQSDRNVQSHQRQDNQKDRHDDKGDDDHNDREPKGRQKNQNDSRVDEKEPEELAGHFQRALADFEDRIEANCTCAVKNVVCDILSHTGERIGSILVAKSWLLLQKRRRGEFVLLSRKVDVPVDDRFSDDGVPDTAASGPDEGEGDTQSTFYVMLIDWRDRAQGRVATRVGIAEIQENHWLDAQREEKTIVLN